MLVEQTVRHVQSIVGIDADQVRIKRRVMDFGERQAILYDRLSKPLVLIGNDVCGVEKSLLR